MYIMYFLMMVPFPQPIWAFGVLDETTLAHYEDLMVAVPQLSTVTDLTVRTIWNNHAHGASIAKLLSRSSHIDTLTVIVDDEVSLSLSFSTTELNM